MVKKQIEEKKEIKQMTVKELPKQEVRSFIGEDDKEYEVFTIEERLDQIVEELAIIKKAILS